MAEGGGPPDDEMNYNDNGAFDSDNESDNFFQTPPPEEAERLGREYWERRMEAYAGWEAKQMEEETKAKADQEAKKGKAIDQANPDPEPTDEWSEPPNGLPKKKKKRRNGRGRRGRRRRRGGVRGRKRQERKATAVESAVPNANVNVRVSESFILEMESVNTVNANVQAKTNANSKTKVDDKDKNNQEGKDKKKDEAEDKGQQTQAAGPAPQRPQRAENPNRRDRKWKRPSPRTPNPFDDTGFEYEPLDFGQGLPQRVQMEPPSTRPNSTLNVDALLAAILAVPPPTGPSTAPKRQQEPECPRQGRPREIPGLAFTQVPATAEAKARGPAQSGADDNKNGVGIKAATAKPDEKVKEEKSPKPRNAGFGIEGGSQGKEAQKPMPPKGEVKPKEGVKEEVEIPDVNGPTPYQKFMNELFANLKKEKNKKGEGGSGNGSGRGEKKKE